MKGLGDTFKKLEGSLIEEAQIRAQKGILLNKFRLSFLPDDF